MLKEILEELEQNEIMGNIDPQDKKFAKKVAKAKAKANCSGNLTPSKIAGASAIRYKCTPKDRAKSIKMSKVRKKFNLTGDAKQTVKKTLLTKNYRKK